MAMRVFWMVALAGSLACSSSAKTTADGSDAATGMDAASDAGATAPASPVGEALTWVLRALNGYVPTQAEITAELTADFLQQVPASDVGALLVQLSQARPWTLKELVGTPTPSALVAVLSRADGQYWRLALVVDPAGHIGGAQIQQAPDLDPALATWEEVVAAVGALAPRANLLAATVDATGCTPLHALAMDENLALGSAFKLWVLAAVAADVAAGRHAWDEMVPIQDALKSLPSGTLQEQPAGTVLPLRAFADHMISISDNTAADHLLFLTGRASVEAMLATSGHHDPTVNQPFLSTRELFNLKLMVSSAEQQAYLDASIDDKRKLLAQYDAAYDPRTYTGAPWLAPKAIDRLEWFATPGDLCGVMRTLRDAGAQPATAPVLDVLALNPGLPDAVKAFSYIGFKGGSEPGVMNLTWLLRRSTDSPWLFFTVAWNDPLHALDEDRATYVAGAGRALLGRTQP